MCNYKNTKFDYETKLIDSRKQQITDIYTNELQFANNEITKENVQKIVAQLVVENANMQRRIHDILQENTEWKLENQRLNNNIEIIQSDLDNIGKKLGLKEGTCVDDLLHEIDNLKDELEWWKQQCDDLEMQIGDNN